jgi:glycosyltransferase involved in cell wall biosynthesis
MGTRGVPGNYGGFETFAEELSARLAKRGHAVTVYCRTSNSASRARSYRGARLVHLPAVRHKAVETLSHTLISALHGMFHRYDIVYVCNSANAPICFIPWLRRQRVVLNVDGLEWRRQKWGGIAKRYYRWAARLAAHMPIEVVTDAVVIQDYYQRVLKRSTRCFAYGTDLYPRGHLAASLESLDLEPDGYVLYVSRMEPENNALLVVDAFRSVETDLPLVMVGDAPYAKEYVEQVRAAADRRVRFLGYRFGDEYHALMANARVYLQATEVGGTHPALVEAMGHGNAILAQDVPEHHEVLGATGEYFALHDAASLAAGLSALLVDAEARERRRVAAAARAEAHFGWDAVTTAYEAYFEELARR